MTRSKILATHGEILGSPYLAPAYTIGHVWYPRGELLAIRGDHQLEIQAVAVTLAGAFLLYANPKYHSTMVERLVPGKLVHNARFSANFYVRVQGDRLSDDKSFEIPWDTSLPLALFAELRTSRESLCANLDAAGLRYA